jgi:hypothetical protein
MSGSGNKEDLSERKELLPVQFGQVGSDLDRVVVVPRQRDGLKFRFFILASLFQDAGQSIMQRYQSAHTEWLSFLLLRNPFFELRCHPLEVVVGRIICVGCSHRHGRCGEGSFVRYPLYAAGAEGFWPGGFGSALELGCRTGSLATRGLTSAEDVKPPVQGGASTAYGSAPHGQLRPSGDLHCKTRSPGGACAGRRTDPRSCAASARKASPHGRGCPPGLRPACTNEGKAFGLPPDHREKGPQRSVPPSTGSPHARRPSARKNLRS